MKLRQAAAAAAPYTTAAEHSAMGRAEALPRGFSLASVLPAARDGCCEGSGTAALPVCGEARRGESLPRLGFQTLRQLRLDTTRLCNVRSYWYVRSRSLYRHDSWHTFSHG